MAIISSEGPSKLLLAGHLKIEGFEKPLLTRVFSNNYIHYKERLQIYLHIFTYKK